MVKFIFDTITCRGLMIGPYDILIVTQALSENLTLVTDNVDEFQST